MTYVGRHYRPSPAAASGWTAADELLVDIIDDFKVLEDHLTAALTLCDELAAGVEATRGRDFGRGVAHAERLFRAVLTMDPR